MDPDMATKAAELGERYGYSMPVARLLALGGPRDGIPDRWMTADELGLAPEHVAEIIRVMMDERWVTLDADLPEVYAPIHAWRVLADLRAEEAIPALIELLVRSDEDWFDWATEEVPEVLGIIGPPAIPALSAYLQTCSDDRSSCTDVVHALKEIGTRHPDERDRCVRILTANLERHAELDPTLNGFLISYLIDLKAVESAPVMESAFAAGDVDLFIAGDREDVEIELGLRTERSTPPWDPRKGLFEKEEPVVPREPAPQPALPRKERTAKKASASMPSRRAKRRGNGRSDDDPVRSPGDHTSSK